MRCAVGQHTAPAVCCCRTAHAAGQQYKLLPSAAAQAAARNLNIVPNYDKITWVLSNHEFEALTPQLTPQVIEYHKKWHDSNELAKCYILASMNSILQKQHEGMGNAVDIMLHLHEMFGTKTRFAKVKAINAFKDLKQKLREPVKDYMLKVISCLNEAELNVAEIDAETQISMIVHSLNSSFSQFKLDYELHARDYTLSALMNDLQNVEEVLDLKKKLEAHAISTSKPKPKDNLGSGVTVAACEAAKEAVWLCKFLMDLEVIPDADKPITLYCDNSGALANSKEPRNHKAAKHIKRKYHLIREIIQHGEVLVKKIPTEQNLADPFTKTLTQKSFDRHLEGLGMRDMSYLL
ncbi:hypothetical protein QQP08_013082 [Theobroma cacao]|nr:hypothetical protein QQP08_013082 [Theobroma cacao]